MIASKENCMRWLEQQPEGRYEVRKARKKRTLDQNAYYWSLLAQLAGALGVSNDELHFEMLKRYSHFDSWATFENVDYKKADSFKYSEEYARDGKVMYVRRWKRSSEMDTKEFKRLLDGLISECKEVGIDVRTPEEIAMEME